MKCDKCQLDKDISLFRNLDKNLCMSCERELILQKMLKYQNFDMGLECLDRTLESIIVKSYYLIYTTNLPLEKAISLVEENRAQVYKPDMIYLLEPEEDSWVVKFNVMGRDNYRCHYCNELGNTVDHITPRSLGGKYTEENLVCCCQDCNYARYTMPYSEFKENWFELKQKYIQEQIQKEELKKRNRKINKKQEEAKKQSRIPNVLQKQKQKYDWNE